MIRKPLAVVLLLALCAGCGVRPSKVIPGATGPTVAAAGVPIYLVRGGKPAMVLRSSPKGDIASALTALATGVSAEEAAQGFTTEVPRSAAPIGWAPGSGGQVTVSLAIDPAELSPAAVQQIACTARSPVRLVGGGVATGLVSCLTQ